MAWLKCSNLSPCWGRSFFLLFLLHRTTSQSVYQWKEGQSSLSQRLERLGQVLQLLGIDPYGFAVAELDKSVVEIWMPVNDRVMDGPVSALDRGICLSLPRCQGFAQRCHAIISQRLFDLAKFQPKVLRSFHIRCQALEKGAAGKV